MSPQKLVHQRTRKSHINLPMNSQGPKCTQNLVHSIRNTRNQPLTNLRRVTLPGNDSALAVMSEKPRMLYDYFKQLFAQVTNPAIDSIREEVVMALECYIGPEQNLLEPREENAHRVRVPHPILTNDALTALKYLDYRNWR